MTADTPRNRAIAAAVHANVLTVREIGRAFGVSASRASAIAKAYGASRQGRLSANGRMAIVAAQKKRRDRHLHGPQIKQESLLAAALVDEGLTYDAAAMELGLTRGAVAGAVRRSRRREARETEGRHEGA